MFLIVCCFDGELGAVALLVNVTLSTDLQMKWTVGGKECVVSGNFPAGVVGDTRFNAVLGVNFVFIFNARWNC